LGFGNNAAGYVQLERELGNNNLAHESVSDRSIQLMMYQGQFLKHRKCAIIRENVLKAATLRKGILADDDLIDEHEWFIPRLQNILERVSLQARQPLPELTEIVADAADTNSGFIKEMMKYRRCLRHEAEAVQAAVVSMAPEVLVLGKPRDGRIGVRVDNAPLDGRETLPISPLVRVGVED